MQTSGPSRLANMSTTTESDTIFDFSSQDAVTLVVGAEQKELLVHGTYLTRDSEFFKAALKKEWTEGQTRRITLPEDLPKTMSHYLTYIYHNKLPPSDFTPTERIPVGNSYLLLVNLYLCSERFLNRPLQHDISWHTRGFTYASLASGPACHERLQIVAHAGFGAAVRYGPCDCILRQDQDIQDNRGLSQDGTESGRLSVRLLPGK
jgi:hypothetical protein